LIDRQATAPGPVRLLSAAAAIIRSDIRFFGILALLLALISIAPVGTEILLRSQPFWLQLPIAQSTSVLSFLAIVALTTINLGAVDRIAGGIRATASGAREDLKRAYLPLLGITILQTVLFAIGFAPFRMVMFVVFYATISQAWWIFALVSLPIVTALIYVTLRLSLASAAVVLGRMGPLKALSASWTRTRGHLLRILGVYLPILPYAILIVAMLAMGSMSAQSGMNPQDLSAAFAAQPTPIVDSLSLVSASFAAIISLWIGAAFALLWRHLDGSGAKDGQDRRSGGPTMCT
jgi:hypothetical protein